VIPTLDHYSHIVSDIPSGSIYVIFILTFYLTIYDILSGIYFDILSYSIWHSIWHSSLQMYLAYRLTFFLAFYLIYLRRFFVVEVRLGPLRSRACSWGPAEEEEQEAGGGTADIKSKNPHLTGGEWTESAVLGAFILTHYHIIPRSCASDLFHYKEMGSHGCAGAGANGVGSSTRLGAINLIQTGSVGTLLVAFRSIFGLFGILSQPSADFSRDLRVFQGIKSVNCAHVRLLLASAGAAVLTKGSELPELQSPIRR
jgi:hypothetical protein